MIKDGLTGIAFTMAMASRSVPSASGFAALSKPIWLSLICRNVKPLGSAARASPIIPTEWGTPPLTVQSTPVPAQTMHSSTSRRPNPCPRSSRPFLDISHLPAGARRLQLAPNCAAKQETRSSRALFPKHTIFRSVPFPAPIAHFNAPDQWSRARRYSARVDHDVYFKLEPAARRSSAKTYSECRYEMLAQLIRFRNLTGSRPTHCGTRGYPSHGFRFHLQRSNPGIVQVSARKPTKLPRLILRRKTHGE